MIKYFLPFLLMTILLFQFIGNFRATGTIEGALLSFLNSSQDRGVAISTIGPSAYTLVATIGQVDEHSLSLLFGSSYLDYIFRILPSSLGLSGGRGEDIADILVNNVEAIGGAHFGTEAYLNGGLPGAIIFAALTGCLVNAVSSRSRNSFLMAAFYMSIIFYLPRFLWYGNIYMFKLCIFFSILFLLRKILVLGSR